MTLYVGLKAARDEQKMRVEVTLVALRVGRIEREDCGHAIMDAYFLR
jgi:hypothetical protein